MKDPHKVSMTPEILYQDESLIAIMKPAGLLSIPDGYDPAIPHVSGILAGLYGKLWIVHRLDRETSGVMILAKSSASHRDLNIQFEHREVKKCYHTLLFALPDWEAIHIDMALKINGDRKHRTVVDLIAGKPAQTSFAVVSRYTAGSLIEANPQSGYTHQIRAHLAAIGLPIMGDQLYFSIQPNAPYQKLPKSSGIEIIGRVALHARSITFRSPETGLPVKIEAPYPDDFQTALQKLK